MKTWRRFAILVLVTALLLAGCNTKPADPTTTGNSDITNTPTTTGATPSSTEDPANNTTDPAETEYSVAVQYLPEKVENPDDLPVLKWVVLTQYRYGGLNQTRTEDAVHEVNQMLADKDMPFRVQFILLSTNSRDAIWDWFGIPQLKEAVEPYLLEADLIWGVMNADNRQTYLSPITEYVTGTTEPTLKNAVAHQQDWKKTRVNGEIYGILTTASGPVSTGWHIDPMLLAKCGLSAEDFDCDFWEMDDVFAKVYEKLGNKPFLTCLNGGYAIAGDKTYYPAAIYEMFSLTYHHIGACFIVDYSSGIPKVINYLESDTVRNIQKAMIRYQNAGYVKVSGLSKNDTITFAGTIGDTQYIDDSGMCCVPMTPSVMKYSSIPNTSGVGAASQHKEEAIQLLNLIAEDEAFRMQLMFGKEGRDYNVVNGSYVPLYQEDGSSYCLDMLSQYAYFSGLSTDGAKGLSVGTGRNWIQITHEGKTKLQTYRDVMDNIDIAQCPITFDCTAFVQEFAAMEEIFKEYFPDFIKNEGEDRMTDERYNEMLQKLKDAGSEKIQAELQRQLDEWLAENPDWLELYG